MKVDFYDLLEEDFGGDVSVATGQIPRIANETLLFVRENRSLNARNIGVERSIASHNCHDVIKSFLPSGFGGSVHWHLLFSGFQEQAGRFLFLLKFKLVFNKTLVEDFNSFVGLTSS